jgi:hypothetical protein
LTLLDIWGRRVGGVYLLCGGVGKKREVSFSPPDPFLWIIIPTMAVMITPNISTNTMIRIPYSVEVIFLLLHQFARKLIRIIATVRKIVIAVPTVAIVALVAA